MTHADPKDRFVGGLGQNLPDVADRYLSHLWVARPVADEKTVIIWIRNKIKNYKCVTEQINYCAN